MRNSAVGDIGDGIHCDVRNEKDAKPLRGLDTRADAPKVASHLCRRLDQSRILAASRLIMHMSVSSEKLCTPPDAEGGEGGARPSDT